MNRPSTLNEARRQSNIAQRAQNMFTREGGYVAYANSLTGVWSVQNPQGTRYAVTLGRIPTCDCPDFAKHGDYCKHTYGLQLQLEREEEEETCAEYDFRYGACENELTGCDSYAQF